MSRMKFSFGKKTSRKISWLAEAEPGAQIDVKLVSSRNLRITAVETGLGF